MSQFDKFLLWEIASRDVIDFKKTYVDMANDLNAGLMLSEIVYWYLPSKEDGATKLRVKQDDFLWIACARYEWWDRTRLSPYEADRALKLLAEAKLIIKHTYRFYGNPTLHVRINEDVFMQRWSEILNNPPVNPYLPVTKLVIGENPITLLAKTQKRNKAKPNNVIGKTPKSLTENNASNTASVTTGGGDSAANLALLVSEFIDVWVKAWAGKPSGNPFNRKTYREDAEAALNAYSLAEVRWYTAQKALEKRWESSRPSWTIWYNDMGAWLAKHPLPGNKPDEQQSEETDPERLTRVAAIRERMRLKKQEESES